MRGEHNGHDPGAGGGAGAFGTVRGQRVPSHKRRRLKPGEPGASSMLVRPLNVWSNSQAVSDYQNLLSGKAPTVYNDRPSCFVIGTGSTSTEEANLGKWLMALNPRGDDMAVDALGVLPATMIFNDQVGVGVVGLIWGQGPRACHDFFFTLAHTARFASDFHPPPPLASRAIVCSLREQKPLLASRATVCSLREQKTV